MTASVAIFAIRASGHFVRVLCECPLPPQQACDLLNLARKRKDRKSTRLNSSHVKISYAVHPDLHSFPTRRSSDLARSMMDAAARVPSVASWFSVGLLRDDSIRSDFCNTGKWALC